MLTDAPGGAAAAGGGSPQTAPAAPTPAATGAAPAPIPGNLFSMGAAQVVFTLYFFSFFAFVCCLVVAIVFVVTCERFLLIHSPRPRKHRPKLKHKHRLREVVHSTS